MVLNGNNHNTFVSAIETVMFAEDSERVMKQYLFRTSARQRF
jgi:hypothetical protein